MTSDLLFYISVYSILFFSSECLCPLNGSIGQKSVSEIESKRQKERGETNLCDVEAQSSFC